MAVPDPKLARDLNRNRVEFLCTDCDTALTFAQSALEAEAGSDRRLRNREKARYAYDTVVELSAKVTFAEADKVVFDKKLSALKAALVQLGEEF